ncbi:uncharacterized protein [Dermacentor andersoni]|uniref:uncharacterized protein isoform X2 n=1 Tax=Dermacentor andersoni TaxID=34620 RepID=UPI002416BB2B|nr:uncharacterized protein LOC129386926 isoform X2 [Dermacentor andersoni]
MARSTSKDPCFLQKYYFDRRHLADKFLRKSQGCHPRVKNGDSRKERNKNGDKENKYYFDRRHLADKFLRKSQGCHPRVKNGDSRKERNKNGDKENDATAGGNCPMEVLQHPSGGPRDKFRLQPNPHNLEPENMDFEKLKHLNTQRPNPPQLGLMLQQRPRARQGVRSCQARNQRHSLRHQQQAQHQQQQGARAEDHVASELKEQHSNSTY